ncbi:nicotinate-nucleotide adenylyltransferase [Aestuariibacter sp. AA17]|uniref:Probable nicotinate-nucleotide adenylyltransferase n=1 Tax=Fluctibacter corallii TaxID=2984329 RepID=A0ABT3A5L5_9ALTE|nr:nicotinate-nucleotide adenylyltransferase [Aestuariibacter sp. AA17]MCV2883975.1 nicotinate-nucleotide adenylyltransferase [Aestuariibacter sp. AA17]
MSKNKLGIFGGTFDPLHNGHLLAITETMSEVSLSEVTLVPCHVPPHKAEPTVTPAHRLEMVTRVCEQTSGLSVNDWEITQSTPSYTVETLSHLTLLHPNTTLYFFMGMDSLYQFTTWHKWEQILELAHLIVFNRRNSADDGVIPAELIDKIVATPLHLNNQTQGLIYISQSQIRDISSTDIRARIKMGQPWQQLVPSAVSEYIQAHHLYA